MSRTFVRPFAAGDVPAAGVLLAQRHARHRVSRPLLSARYEESAAATAEVALAFGTPGVSGAFAVRGGEPVGYLLGFPKPGRLWGPNVWVESAGHAAVDGETLRDLYAVAAAGWVACPPRPRYAGPGSPSAVRCARTSRRWPNSRSNCCAIRAWRPCSQPPPSRRPSRPPVSGPSTSMTPATPRSSLNGTAQ